MPKQNHIQRIPNSEINTQGKEDSAQTNINRMRKSTRTMSKYEKEERKEKRFEEEEEKEGFNRTNWG